MSLGVTDARIVMIHLKQVKERILGISFIVYDKTNSKLSFKKPQLLNCDHSEIAIPGNRWETSSLSYSELFVVSPLVEELWICSVLAYRWVNHWPIALRSLSSASDPLLRTTEGQFLQNTLLRLLCQLASGCLGQLESLAGAGPMGGGEKPEHASPFWAWASISGCACGSSTVPASPTQLLLSGPSCHWPAPGAGETTSSFRLLSWLCWQPPAVANLSSFRICRWPIYLFRHPCNEFPKSNPSWQTTCLHSLYSDSFAKYLGQSGLLRQSQHRWVAKQQTVLPVLEAGRGGAGRQRGRAPGRAPFRFTDGHLWLHPHMAERTPSLSCLLLSKH